MSEDKSLTPLMRQYHAIKKLYPDMMLMFQVGDFYELFFEDAQQAASVLGIALTQRGTYNGQPIPLAGVPLHVIDHYMSKLVRAGYKVALCDQLEAARPGKVVERGVTRVLTPGTLTDTALLQEKSASYLSVFFPLGATCLFVSVELLTGHVVATVLESSAPVFLETELARFMPDEILIPREGQGALWEPFFRQHGYAVSFESFDQGLFQEVFEWYKRQFAHTETPFESLSGALILLYGYLKKNNPQGLAVLKQLSFYLPDSYVLLDASTQRNLELVRNAHDGSSSHTLFSVLDCAVTPMGSRLLKKWIVRPLLAKEQIEKRLDVVDVFFRNHLSKSELRKQLRTVGDFERIIGRFALKRAHVHDYMALIKALSVIPNLKQGLKETSSNSILSFIERLDDFATLRAELDRALSVDPSKEWIIQQGFNEQLDRLRNLIETGAGAVLALERREQERTGISTLKIRYNQVHGYGIEITNANAHLVPADYLRVQTLAQRERYTTQELKALESDLQRARSEVVYVEKELFDSVKVVVESYVPLLKQASSAIASLDCLLGLAEAAYSQGYVRPLFHDRQSIEIEQGRHPVVEKRLSTGFIPNDVSLTPDNSLWIITGPNMGGKSTFLRQVALIAVMAQIGSFVPAKAAHLPLVDRIFTRLGAADNLSEGKSTFLIEMEETATICNLATPKSLIILDEVGRGTSTFDGLALAQSVVEYIAHRGSLCLFATHYHELTALKDTIPTIGCYYAASAKTEQGIVLLHQIVVGIADGSFGLEIAAAAHLPPMLVARAREILDILTETKRVSSSNTTDSSLYRRIAELEELLIQQKKELQRTSHALAEFAQLDCESLTARQALEIVWKVKESMR
ncbi:DNA mismatch repair protein MutS [Candidatus Dependentiae bacterium]|nr:DNA mismatch repair protein MutS [Candidatus Dependentiae bacterium]